MERVSRWDRCTELDARLSLRERTHAHAEDDVGLGRIDQAVQQHERQRRRGLRLVGSHNGKDRQMRRKLDGKVHALTSATQDVASLEQFNERAATTAYSSVRHPKLMN